MEFINGKDDIPYIMTIMENNPAMFETTNQVNTFFVYHLFADTKKMSLWNTQSGHRCLHFVALPGERRYRAAGLREGRNGTGCLRQKKVKLHQRINGYS